MSEGTSQSQTSRPWDQEEWTVTVQGLRENYVLANENYKYLGTLQEFLLVS